MTVESRPPGDESIGELITRLSAQTSRLVRDEMRLAQKEFTDSVRHAGKGAGLISAAGILAFLGLATLIAASVAALSLVLPVWAAALIVGVVLLGTAGIAAMVSRGEVEKVTPPVPQTTENVKRDIDSFKGDAFKGDALKGDAFKVDAVKGDAVKGDAVKGDDMKGTAHVHR